MSGTETYNVQIPETKKFNVQMLGLMKCVVTRTDTFNVQMSGLTDMCVMPVTDTFNVQVSGLSEVCKARKSRN